MPQSVQLYTLQLTKAFLSGCIGFTGLIFVSGGKLAQWIHELRGVESVKLTIGRDKGGFLSKELYIGRSVCRIFQYWKY